MTGSFLAVAVIATFVSVAFWTSMRVAARAELSLLPARYRRRVQWWQGNERAVQLSCAAVAVAAACVELAVSVG